jgi:hypothetical protein
MANQGCFDYLQKAVNAAPLDKTLKGNVAASLVGDVEDLLFSDKSIEYDEQDRGSNPASVNFSKLSEEIQADISSAENPTEVQPEQPEPSNQYFNLDEGTQSPYASKDIEDR